MTFGPTFQRTFQPTFDRRNSAGAWWNLFGVIPLANCVAAYSPKGAADLAASYVNLVTPGTYNAAPGSAPGWDVTNGWIFDATSKYLVTGVVPASGYSMIIRFSGISGTSGNGLFGQFTTNARFEIYPNFNVGNPVIYANGNGFKAIVTAMTSGVLAIAGNIGYRNGSVDTTAIGTWTTTTTKDIYIARINGFGTSIVSNIQAVAIYNNDQSANIAKLTTAMNAL